MRQPRAGLVDGLDVTELLQLLGTQFRFVEFTQQLRQQIEMPGQCRTEGLLGVNGKCQQAMPEFRARPLAPPRPARPCLGAPFATVDPGQAGQALQRLGEEPVGLIFTLQGVGQFMQPALEGQAERQQVAGKEHAEAGKTEPRVPGPGKQQQDCAQDNDRDEKRLEVAALDQQHGGNAAQHQHRQHEENEGAVDEIDHFRLVFGLLLDRQDRHHGEEQRQHELRQKQVFAGQHEGTGQHLRHQHDEQHADQIGQDEQIEELCAASDKEEDLAADDARKRHHPPDQHPVAGPESGAGNEPGDHQQLQGTQAQLGPHERLPKDEQADMPYQQCAADAAIDALQQQQMQ